MLVRLVEDIWVAAMTAHIYDVERMPRILVAGKARHSDASPLQLQFTASFYALYARQGVTGRRKPAASTAMV